MKWYIARRIGGMFPTLALISVIVFVVIQLPPGDIVTSTLDRMQAQGIEVSAEQVQNLRAQYNLDKPLPLQYVSWALIGCRRKSSKWFLGSLRAKANSIIKRSASCAIAL